MSLLRKESSFLESGLVTACARQSTHQRWKHMNQKRKFQWDDNYVSDTSALARREALWKVSHGLGEMSGNSHSEAALEVPGSWMKETLGEPAFQMLGLEPGTSHMACVGSLLIGGLRGKSQGRSMGEAGSSFLCSPECQVPHGAPSPSNHRWEMEKFFLVNNPFFLPPRGLLHPTTGILHVGLCHCPRLPLRVRGEGKRN